MCSEDLVFSTDIHIFTSVVLNNIFSNLFSSAIYHFSGKKCEVSQFMTVL